MSSTQRTRPPGERFGQAVAVVLQGLMLYGLLAWPGWNVLPFLRADFDEVVGLLSLSLAVGIIASLAQLLFGDPWVRPGSDLVTTGIGIAVLTRLLRVFPFDFAGTFPWETVVRVLLVLGLIGAAIGMVVHAVSLVRALSGPHDSSHGATRAKPREAA